MRVSHPAISFAVGDGTGQPDACNGLIGLFAAATNVSAALCKAASETALVLKSERAEISLFAREGPCVDFGTPALRCSFL